jgi:hypothetical protein
MQPKRRGLEEGGGGRREGGRREEGGGRREEGGEEGGGEDTCSCKTSSCLVSTFGASSKAGGKAGLPPSAFAPRPSVKPCLLPLS